ncbi:MAG TPA: phosphotransacetylase family protein [Anaerolineae bacterium]|nr:phosphotransacetylase family protein [Anaerolineae bacterium]
MATLYIVSTEAHSGKTGLCLSLGLELKERGLKIGYMKPIGTLPGRIDDTVVDLDAYYVLKRLNTGDDIEHVSPIALTRQFMAAHFKEEAGGIDVLIKHAFASVSEGKDVVLVENGADVNEGRFMNAAAFQLADLMDAKTILLVKFRSELVVDDILEAQDLLKDMFHGVIFNQVTSNDRPIVDTIISYLEKKGIKTYGVIPRDRTLKAVTIDEIAAHLNGTILTAADKTGELVENFMVGAMGQEKAFRFFQTVANKAVITGGDRADVQIAALETPTKALILTGNFQPSPIVMAKAEDKGVPMILVNLDTITAVEKTDELVGRVRIHQDQKVRKFRDLVRSGVDLEALFTDAGI